MIYIGYGVGKSSFPVFARFRHASCGCVIPRPRANHTLCASNCSGSRCNSDVNASPPCEMSSAQHITFFAFSFLFSVVCYFIYVNKQTRHPFLSLFLLLIPYLSPLPILAFPSFHPFLSPFQCPSSRL